MIKGVSIIICCYNSEERIVPTLQHLAKQVVNEDILWEIILVDNASTDYTSDIASKVWSRLYSETSLNIVYQTIPGLSFAREKGIEISKYEFLLFCDDDNWLASDYIQKGYDIMNRNNDVAVLGGFGLPMCEISPPKWFEHYSGIYATGSQYKKSGVMPLNMTVYGAASFYRKTSINEIKANGFRFKLKGREKNILSTGEDRELNYALILNGNKTYYSDSLLFQHFIPKERLTRNYRNHILKGAVMASPVLMGYQMKILNLQKKRPLIKNSWIYITIMQINIAFLNLLKRKGNKKYIIEDFKWKLKEIYYFILKHTQYSDNLK